jgi:hypothetical protein
MAVKRLNLRLGPITRILMLITALVGVILLKDMCGQTVSGLVNTVAPPVAGDAGSKAPVIEHR